MSATHNTCNNGHLHGKDNEVSEVLVDGGGAQEFFRFPVVVDVASVDLIHDTAKAQKHREDHEDRTSHVVPVVEVEGPLKSIEYNDDASNSDHQRKHTQNIVDGVSVAPPVFCVSVRVQLSEGDHGPCEPHQNAVKCDCRVAR